MKKTNRKAFTLVELVIVIAVIAVLAGVMIPTFGAIIKSANKSSDESTAASINTQLSMDLDGIRSESDIYEAVAAAFGNADATLSPKSAKYGYHYWYDVEEGIVRLNTYEEIAELNGTPLAAAVEEPTGVQAIAVVAQSPKDAFMAAHGESYRMFFEKYFILDKGGSDIGEALKAVDEGAANISEMLEKLNVIAGKNSDKNKEIAAEIINRLGAVSKVTDFTISASGSDVVEGLNVAYASYHITNLKLSASGFITDTGAPTSKTVTWTSSNDNLATIDADGNVTVKTAILSDPNATVRFTATVDDYSEYVDVYFVYPRNLDFTLGGVVYDMIIGEDEHDVTITFDGSTHTFAFTDFVPYLNVSEETANVNCDYNVVVSTTGNSLFTISNNVLTLEELASYDGITQDFTVNVGTAITKTFTVSINDISAEPFEKNEPFANPEFLYVIGNGNSIPLRVFFNSEKPGDATLGIYDFARSIGNTNAPIGADPNLTATVNGETSATGEWAISASDWANTMIKFTGTGVAKIKLGEVELVFEVVDGNNVVPNATGNTIISSPAAGTNVILLSNVYISSGAKYNLTNSTLFGNGFTFDVSAGNYSATGYVTENHVVRLSGSTLNNVKIIGKNFDNFAATSDKNNNICNVISTGNNVIANSYISGCASPVRLTNGNLEIINSTLSGGSFANLDIRSGSVVLDNVTTINQQSVAGQPASEGKLGFGVAVWYEQVSSCNITIKNDLKQYNYVTEEEVEDVSFEGSSVLNGAAGKDAVFANTEYVYTDGNGTKWINLGIISLTDEVDSNNLNFASFNDRENYQAKTVSFTMNLGLTSVTKNGFFYAQKGSVANLQNPGEFDSEAQYYFKPSYAIDNSDNNQAIQQGSNVYCVMDGEEVNISFDQGGSKTFNFTNFMSASKYGKGLELTDVYLDGVNVTANGSVIFNAEGTYTLKFVFDDIYNYNTDGTLNNVQFEKIVTVNVNVVAPDAKNAEFSFNGTAGNKVFASDKTYISANVNATSSSWGSIIVGDQTVYYPIVNATYTSAWTLSGTEYQAFFPVFKDIISITDYENAGTGNAVEYKDNGSNTVMPTGLTLVKGFNGTYTGDANFAGVADSNLNTTGAEKVFQWSAGSTAASAPKYQNDVFSYATPSGLRRSGDHYWIVQYSYTDNAGSTFYYYVGYVLKLSSGSSGGSSGGCFAEGSLVTLADGTQKPIEEITFEDQILAWDFNTGTYVATVASLIDRYEASQQNVINLKFSDGTVVRMVVDHGFFDVDANSFVFLNEENVASYVGHTFVKASEDGTYENVELVGYEITVETVAYYAIQTAIYNNCIVDGMFTLTAPPEMIKYSDWFNYFEIGEGMKYDEEKMQADIEQYGLYTYEDFADYVTYEQFIAFNGPYLKVLVGRGVVTYDQIIELIGMYVNPEN